MTWESSSADKLSPRQQEFAERVSALLAEYRDVIGPVDNSDDDEPLTAVDLDERAAVANGELTEWVICAAWVDMDSGRSFTTKASRPGMLTHHQSGLLRTWIHDLEE